MSTLLLQMRSITGLSVCASRAVLSLDDGWVCTHPLGREQQPAGLTLSVLQIVLVHSKAGISTGERELLPERSRQQTRPYRGSIAPLPAHYGHKYHSRACASKNRPKLVIFPPQRSNVS